MSIASAILTQCYVRKETEDGSKGRPTAMAAAAYNGGDIVYFGFAICHENDQFIKRVARAKVHGRLKSKRYYVKLAVVGDKPILPSEEHLLEQLKDMVKQDDNDNRPNVLPPEAYHMLPDIEFCIRESYEKFFYNTGEDSNDDTDDQEV